MIDRILFDLDGTLTDPAEGITGSVRYALEKMGLPVPAQRELQRFIGPPLDEGFAEHCGMQGEEVHRAVALFREYFAQQGIFENKLFPGIPALLQELVQAGKKLYVATSKPSVFAGEVLDRFDLSQYFEDVCGSPIDHFGVSKADIVRTVIEVNGILPKNAVMVGDRRHDVVGAKANGLLSVGVLFGYGSRDELAAAGADYIARDIEELRNILLCEL